MKQFSDIFSSPKTSFQILSDLYLNHESQYLTFHTPVSAPYLILAGNIGRLVDYDAYLSFLIRRCNLYERVYLVLGALEFHGLGIKYGPELASRLEKETGVKGKLVVLNRVRADVPGTNVTLLGCTLWSHIPSSSVPAVLKKASEFDSENGIRHWTVAAHNAAHERDLAWLKREVTSTRRFAGLEDVSSSKPSHVMVISSFAPELRQTLEPWQVDSPWVAAYGTNLLDDHVWGEAKTWICGSTGRTTEFKTNGIKVVTNQRGCVGEDVKGILPGGISEKERKHQFDVTRTLRV
jgi:hypothetical protein